jgi:hypothetical protein
MTLEAAPIGFAPDILTLPAGVLFPVIGRSALAEGGTLERDCIFTLLDGVPLAIGIAELAAGGTLE